jgi:hypothetical protein
MINFPFISADARNRPSGENDSGSISLECCLMRILVFSFESSGVQMAIFPLPNPLNENQNQKCEIALPFLLVHYIHEKKKTTIPSFNSIV